MTKVFDGILPVHFWQARIGVELPPQLRRNSLT